jgi:hypothetical protein
VADFNLQLTDMSRIPPRHRPLLEAWQSFFNAHELVLQRPQNGPTKLDHVFSRSGFVSQVSNFRPEQFPFSTDHPALTFLLHPPAATQTAPTDQSRRLFCLRPLREPTTSETVAKLLQAEYQKVAPEISKILSLASRFLDSGLAARDWSRPRFEQTIGEIIDWAEAAVLEAVQNCCASVLGERSDSLRATGIAPPPPATRPASRSAATDKAMTASEAPRLRTAVDTIKSYRRLGKSPSSTHIHSATPGMSAVDDAYHRWRSYWQQEAPLQLPFVSRAAEHVQTSVKEVRKLIGRQPLKASHTDGIHASVLKALVPCSFAHHLTTLYNLCLAFQYTPTRWNSALTVLLPKDDTCTSANCRPISIVPLFRTLLEKVVEERLRPKLTELHAAQTGFRRHCDIFRNLSFADSDQRPFKILIDLEKAYDSPDFRNIQVSWQSFGLPTWCRRLLHSLYTRKMTCQLHVNGARSPVIARNQGFFQGTVLSPHLFNIFLEPLLASMNDGENDRCLLAYADDLLLFGSTAHEAQERLATIHRWCGQRSMTISRKKTIALAPQDAIISHPDGQCLPVQDCATYLGVPLHRVGGIDWTRFYDQKIKACRKNVAFMSYNTRSWPLTARLDVFRTFVLPVFEFAGPLFASVSLIYKEATKTFLVAPGYDAIWTALEGFYQDAARTILQQANFSRTLLRVLGWKALKERWTCLFTGQQVHGRSSNHRPSHPLVLAYRQWYDLGPHRSRNRRSFRSFWDELFPPPPSSALCLSRGLAAPTQRHLVHLRRHTFGYKGTCFCGEPFDQRTHFQCLPNDTDCSLEDLFLDRRWADIDALLSLWWTQLAPPNRSD